MLGKTNLTTVEKGAIISDIADYNWNNVRVDEINESFVRTIYVNNVLVAITKSGTVAYTKDGENWETKAIELDNEDYFEFTDIVYGNGKYVIVGWHTDKETYMHGLIAITEDLFDYNVITNAENMDYFEAETTCAKFLGVSAGDGNFTIFYFGSKREGNYTLMSLRAAIVNFKNKANINLASSISMNIGNGFLNFNTAVSDAIFKLARKTDGGTVLYYRCFDQTSYHNGVYVSKDSTSFKRLTDDNMEGGNAGHQDYNTDLFSLFECKDSLYFSANTVDFNYDLTKVIGDSDEIIMSTGIPYGFLDAAYFNKCEVLVNRHEMLIVYPKEKIADKSLDDLIDITYDFSITSIVKAFNKLYIFGIGGNILVSNNEANNEEAIAIKSMSASRALYDAKAYTDKKIEELMASIQAAVDKVNQIDDNTSRIGFLEQSLDTISNDVQNAYMQSTNNTHEIEMMQNNLSNTSQQANDAYNQSNSNAYEIQNLQNDFHDNNQKTEQAFMQSNTNAREIEMMQSEFSNISQQAEQAYMQSDINASKIEILEQAIQGMNDRILELEKHDN